MKEDSTSAFEADAKAAHNGETAEELRARLAELEGEKEPEIYDQKGREVGAESRNTPDVSTAVEVELGGETFRFFPPKPAALVAFGMGSSNRRNFQMQLRTMQRFLEFSLVEEDYDRLLDRMMDPTDDFDEGEMADLVSAIADKVRESPEAKAPANGPR